MATEDAQALFREGVVALRDRKDAAAARKLISQSLKLDPNNEMAWLWLSRTTSDPERQLQCVERALNINPFNDQAAELRRKLLLMVDNGLPEVSVPQPAAPARDFVDGGRAPSGVKRMSDPITPAEEAQLEKLMETADKRLDSGDAEGAVEAWVRVLEMRVDHEGAMRGAVRQLYKMAYVDDAHELVMRALDAETVSLSIHLTAIDLAEARGEYQEAAALREKIVKLPTADAAAILKVAATHEKTGDRESAFNVIETALETRPKDAALLLKAGELLDEMGRKQQAVAYFERAARVGKGQAVKAAEKVLQNFTPVLTDRERGSTLLAVREAFGVVIVALLMAWQDAGLNLLALGAQRWLGVGLSFIGGYLIVTAWSSPQQKPLANWLGGKVPPTPEKPKPKPYEEPVYAPGPVQEPTNLPIIPPALRYVIGVVGIAVTMGAFLLVFQTSVRLLQNPIPPELPSIWDFVEVESLTGERLTLWMR